MYEDKDFFKILDLSVKDITKRVAKIDSVNTTKSVIDSNQVCSLVTSTSGGYDLTLAMYAEKPLFQVIAENMKRRAIETEDDIAIYTTEFFNILCGHVVSATNQMARTDTRFNIPQFIEGYYTVPADKCYTFHYSSNCGAFCIMTFYQYPDCKAS